MSMHVESADRSWTITKVVAVIVAILTAGYMLPWAIAAVRDVPHWGVFWLNLLLGWVYAAQVFGYTCGIVNSYLWNSSWTFREQRTRSLREMLLFLAVNLVSLGVSLGVMWLCREAFGLTNEWAASWMPDALSGFVKGDTIDKLIATFVAIIVNFGGNRLFVFNGNGNAKKPARAE